jgi:hypothetical protein
MRQPTRQTVDGRDQDFLTESEIRQFLDAARKGYGNDSRQDGPLTVGPFLPRR